jgi:hypothetical protein
MSSSLCQKINFEITGSYAYDSTAQFFIETTLIDDAMTDPSIKEVFPVVVPPAPTINILLANLIATKFNDADISSSPYFDDTKLPYYLLKAIYFSYLVNQNAYVTAKNSGNPYAYNNDYLGFVTIEIANGIASGKLNIPPLDELPLLKDLIAGIESYFLDLWLLV